MFQKNCLNSKWCIKKVILFLNLVSVQCIPSCICTLSSCFRFFFFWAFLPNYCYYLFFNIHIFSLSPITVYQCLRSKSSLLSPVLMLWESMKQPETSNSYPWYFSAHPSVLVLIMLLVTNNILKRQRKLKDVWNSVKIWILRIIEILDLGKREKIEHMGYIEI